MYAVADLPTMANEQSISVRCLWLKPSILFLTQISCKEVSFSAGYIIIGVIGLVMLLFVFLALGDIFNKNERGSSKIGAWIGLIFLLVILIGAYRQCAGQAPMME